jgi:hypothetical protein
VSDLRRLAGRFTGEIPLLEKAYAKAAQGSIARDASAVDTSTDDGDIEGATVQCGQRIFSCLKGDHRQILGDGS